MHEGYLYRERSAVISFPVGSRAGAVLRRRGLSVSPRFLWECLTSRTVSPFPAPATSHAACGFPAVPSIYSSARTELDQRRIDFLRSTGHNIRTWEGWLYLSVILDLFSRRCRRLGDAAPPACGACSRDASHGLGAPPAGKWPCVECRE